MKRKLLTKNNIMSKTCTLNRDEVIRRIELNNPGKFDFSPLENWEYNPEKGWSQQITLICKKHNEPFGVCLQHSLKGNIECPLCAKERKKLKSIEGILQNLEKFFPDKYEIISIGEESNKTADCSITLKCKDCSELVTLKIGSLRTCYRQISLCEGCRKPWTENLFKERLNLIYDGRYELVSNFISGNHPVKIKCNYCGEIIEAPAFYCLSASQCKCDKEKLTPELLIKKSKEIWGEDTFEYIDCNLDWKIRSITLKCKKHNEVFTQKIDDHLKHKNSCSECIREVNIKNNLLSNEEFIERCTILYGNHLSYEKTQYNGKNETVIVTCEDHGDVEVIARSLLQGWGCPICRHEKESTSRGEKFLLKIFKENTINFEYQKTFPGCIYKNELRFDFYLPDYNILIEYQGQQHYRPSRFGDMSQEVAEEHFRIQQIKDNIKREFCKKENIKLIEIPYYKDLNKVHKELLEELNINKPL